MAWTPQKNVVDLTKIVDNLLAYIEQNDDAALLWANDNAEALPEFAKLYSNASGRLGTIFPSIMVLTQADEGEESEWQGGDVLLTGLQLTFEVTLTGSKADELVLTTKKYERALKSMLVNCPPATLYADSSIVDAFMKQIGTKFDILRGQKTANSYLQIFQTTVLYALVTERM